MCILSILSILFRLSQRLYLQALRSGDQQSENMPSSPFRPRMLRKRLKMQGTIPSRFDSGTIYPLSGTEKSSCQLLSSFGWRGRMSKPAQSMYARVETTAKSILPDLSLYKLISRADVGFHFKPFSRRRLMHPRTPHQYEGSR